ncbi:membrane-tethered transcription factor [Schizosaccharomyces japonicus yFS275]|uniref:Membrane-tethered transcription factor n=1 Tax=Schizosaccharomyces japonicus (strain yFS275 / FY16936) TaxID=402676 RepID=B6JZK8_SCHJY|nr:membrane-tethered transcription factor [Schizosaccharomyces japonicus yFS275]EEB06976.1 membrane-tethered transcription factor [Schizosaccharomyces japonicus yFS275]
MDDLFGTLDNESAVLEDAKVIPRRRRVTRACDSCRKKKIKCDGTRPCRNCKYSNTECTFQFPSSRKSLFSLEYLEKLESRVRYLERLLKEHTDVNLSKDAPNFLAFIRQHDFAETCELESDKYKETARFVPLSSSGDWFHHPDSNNRYYRGGSSTELFLRTLFAELPNGWRVTDPSSFYAFICNDMYIDVSDMQAQFYVRCPRISPGFQLLSVNVRDLDLPSLEETLHYSAIAMNTANSTACYVSCSAFERKVHQLYAGEYDRAFLPLLAAVLCLGYYDAHEHDPQNQRLQQEAQRYSYIAERLVNPIDVCTIETVQVLLFQSMYRYSRSEVSACWMYLKNALSCSLRLGIHRNLVEGLSLKEIEMRRRVFWALYCYDRHICTIMGFPLGISDEDIDQVLPDYSTSDNLADVNGNITKDKHSQDFYTNGIQLYKIASLILREVYSPTRRRANNGSISCTAISEIEKKMDQFFNNLPRHLQEKANDVYYEKCNRLMYGLQTVYYSYRILLYRPLLHYLNFHSEAMRSLKRFEKQTAFNYACKCVDAAVVAVQNLTFLVKEASKTYDRHYWTAFFNGYNAIVTLIYAAVITRNENMLVYIRQGRETLSRTSRDWLNKNTISLLDKMIESLETVLSKKRSKHKKLLPVQTVTDIKPPNTQYTESILSDGSGSGSGSLSDPSPIDTGMLPSMLKYHEQVITVHHPSFYTTRNKLTPCENANLSPLETALPPFTTPYPKAPDNSGSWGE